MTTHPCAGKPAPKELLINVARLVSDYYVQHPDVNDSAQAVAFGTSGHRGVSTRGSFNEGHILAITQAICDYRRVRKIDGPLFLGMDTHALSEPDTAPQWRCLRQTVSRYWFRPGEDTHRRR